MAFLILFVLMGSVCATNDNIITLSQDAVNEISQENSAGSNDSALDEILKTNHENKTSVSGDTFADIQTAINSAASGIQ